MKTTTSTTKKDIQQFINKLESKIQTLSGFHYELENKEGKLTNTQLEILGIYQGEIFALENVIDELRNIIKY
jgi:peptidoglycan hydrolase CwlO-like protein